MPNGLIPDKLVTDLLDLLRQSGQLGAVAAALIVGLVLAVIVFARTKDLWSDTRGRAQGIEFQDRLLRAFETLQASERALRDRIDAMARESNIQRDEIDELRAGIALLRSQRRRLIELMRGHGSRKPAGVAA